MHRDRAGLILPIAAKEPLSDKKLKQKDYLGSVIFPTLHLLPKTTSARRGDAGNQGPTWARDGPNPARWDPPELHVGAGMRLPSVCQQREREEGARIQSDGKPDQGLTIL